MGLDGVELVMEFEDEFGITITDEEASGLDRVGLVVDCVFGKIKHRRREGCVSAPTFYRFRRTLADLVGTARREVRPNVDLSSLVPVPMRRRLWQGLRTAGLSLPGLQRPKGLVAGLALLVLSVVTLTIIAIAPAFGGQSAALAAVLSCALAGYLAARLSKPWATRIPSTCAQVGDAVLCAVRAPADVLSRGEVSYKVRQIVAEQLGISFSKITEESHFVRDLHLDQ